jgi:23S rRNA pseudouridine2605 synthase
MSKSPFGKFIHKESGAKKKEALRQEKRQVRKEKNAYFESLKQQRRPAGSKALTKDAIHAEPAGNRTAAPRKPQTRIAVTPAAPVKKPAIAITRAVVEEMQLNKFIAHSGVCSRRDAALLVKKGRVTVNGEVVTEPGARVKLTDTVKLDNKLVQVQQNLVYILLNKPKDCLTTVTDPQGRKTVIDIVGNATDERIFPVGRLDRNTTGVLLLTNDGDLAQKLAHPSHGVTKIYEATLDKPLAKSDYEAMMKGLNLEDGFIAPDALAYADPKNKAVVGVEIHSGRNRIVRRMFEHLGYEVKLLDRVMFANLTKKNVERGRFRFLNEREIRNLKFLNSATQNKKLTPKNSRTGS